MRQTDFRLPVFRLPAILIVGFLVLERSAADDGVILTVPRQPAHGLVIARVDFTGIVAHQQLDRDQLLRLRAFSAADNQDVPAQFIPGIADARMSTGSAVSARGLLILKLPPGSGPIVRLQFDGPLPPDDSSFDGSVAALGFSVRHQAGTMGALPRHITFADGGKQFSEFAWNDRVHHEQLGGFLLRHDDQARLDLVSPGPLCTVIRTTASYKRPDGTQPPSRPRAVYQWHYFHDLPLVFVTAAVTQEQSFAWREVHFLELNFPGSDFGRWAGAEPPESGELAGDNSSHRFSNWAHCQMAQTESACSAVDACWSTTAAAATAPTCTPTVIEPGNPGTARSGTTPRGCGSELNPTRRLRSSRGLTDSRWKCPLSSAWPQCTTRSSLREAPRSNWKGRIERSVCGRWPPPDDWSRRDDSTKR